MNYKSFFLASALSLIAFTPTNVYAQTTTVAPTFRPRQELREDREDTRLEIKDLKEGLKGTLTQQRQGLKGSITQTKAQFRQQRMIANQKGLYNSFQVRLKALQSYLTRIQDRLNTKKAKLAPNVNQNLTDAQAKIDSLPALFTNLNSNQAAYKKTIDSIASATDPTTLLVTLKAEAKTVNGDLKGIRQVLVDALRLIVKAK